MEYKIFRQRFDFKNDDSNYNLAFEKKEEEDDLIEALFSNKAINEFMKDEWSGTKKKELPQEKEDFPINKKVIKDDDDSVTSEQLSSTSFEEIRQRKKREKERTMDGFSSDINKTKNIDDFIQENPELKKQYDNLNKYYDFAMKSLKYLIPKFVKGNEEVEGKIVYLIV